MVTTEYQGMLDEGVARYFDGKCLGRIGPRFGAEERFFKVSRCVDGFTWRGDLAQVAKFIALMETDGCRHSAVLGTKATGHGRRPRGRAASGLIINISIHLTDLPFSSKTLMSTIAKPLETRCGGFGEIAQASAGVRLRVYSS